MFEGDDATGGHLGDKFQWQINNNKYEKETQNQHIEKTFFNNNNNCLVSVGMENIELNSLKYNDKNNPVVAVTSPEDNNNYCHHPFNNNKSLGYSYTPERLIKNQNYRILTSSPDFFTDDEPSPQDTMNSIDPYKFGGQYLEALLENRSGKEIQIPSRHRKYLKNKLTKKIETQRKLTCQSVDNNERAICLSDELGIASNRKKIAFNEVVKILESLDSNPDGADNLIEDRFTSGYSEHDRLTRLALSIEQEDVEIINHDDSVDILHQLRGRVEKLQRATKGIYQDIGVLRRDFQFEDEKVKLLEIETSNFREDINELKYLDDLLNLLRGEIERISRRNWPFIIGHTDKPENEEINLVV